MAPVNTLAPGSLPLPERPGDLVGQWLHQIRQSGSILRFDLNVGRDSRLQLIRPELGQFGLG